MVVTVVGAVAAVEMRKSSKMYLKPEGADLDLRLSPKFLPVW